MSNGISQFNVTFEPAQDRLLFRVLTKADEEMRIWLTRRYVRLMYTSIDEHEGVAKLNRSQVAAVPIDSGSDAQALAVENHDASDTQSLSATANTPADIYGETYKATEKTKLPYGEAPLLVTRISLQEKSNGIFNLVMGEEHEGGMQLELGLTPELLTSLMAILREGAKNAEWDLPMSASECHVDMHHGGSRLH